MDRYDIHGAGEVGLSVCNSRIVTWSKNESSVKSWPNGFLQNPNNLDILGEIRHIVTLKIEDEVKLIVATDQMETESFDWPGLTEDTENLAMFRFASDIGYLQAFESSVHDCQIVAGSGDFQIKWKCIGSKIEPRTILGHEAPILSLAIDPLGEILASSSCDGTFRVWKLTDQTEIYQEKLWPRSSDIKYAKSPSTVLIEPVNGQLLAILGLNDIRILQRSDFTRIHTLEMIAECICWSEDGLLLAAGNKNGTVNLYNTKSWMLEKNYKVPGACCDMSFDKNDLLISDNTGHINIVRNLEEFKNVVLSTSEAKQISTTMYDRQDSIETKTKPENPFLDDEAGEDSEIDDLEALWEDEANGSDEPGMENDGPLLMENSQASDKESVTQDISLDAIKKQTVFDQPIENIEEPKDDFEDEKQHWSGPQPSKMQLPFQSTSTPVFLTQRYLCWNSIGIIKGIINEKSGTSSIVVEFHNIMTHHSIQIQNKEDYTIGDVSDTCFILASTGKDSETESVRSVVKVMHYKSWWDRNKEWNIELPTGEFADCVAASSNWVVVATSERSVRLFSTGGAQIQMYSLPGPVCSIAANQEQLFYTYHRGLGFDDNQLLSCGIISTEKTNRRPIPKDIAVSPSTELVWVGFTDEGTPAIYDSEGTIRIVNWNTCMWMPVASTQKLRGAREIDTWFLISVNEGNKELSAILCKNSKYPDVFPRPEIEILPMNVPLINPKSDLSVQEADLIVTRNLEGTISALESRGFDPDVQMQNLVQKQITKTILKMLLGAIQQDADDRGYEICTLLENSQQVQMAIKLANQKRRTALAEKLVELAKQKDGLESEDEDTDEEVNEVVDNGYRQTLPKQFQSKTRIDTDSSRHSEDLFSSNFSSDVINRKTCNPFSKNITANVESTESNQESETTEKGSVFDKMSKVEIKKTSGGTGAKTMREKLAALRKKPKIGKNTSILNSFGKRKNTMDENNGEQEEKKQKSLQSSTLGTMDQFAASDDE